jgi:plasmid stabilization system protein ParE
MPQTKKYRLKYLPLFEKDLAAVKDYIAKELQNPAAAQRLVLAAEKAILQRLNFPLAFEAYPSKRQRKQAYYRIYVKNYTIFYVVIGDTMEVRRCVYSGRDLTGLV